MRANNCPYDVATRCPYPESFDHASYIYKRPAQDFPLHNDGLASHLNVDGMSYVGLLLSPWLMDCLPC